MKNVQGFSLVELLTSMSLGLIVLSTALSFWIALSKDSHREILRLQLSQEYADVVSHLRSTLGRAVLYPQCMNPEWLHRKEVIADGLTWVDRAEKVIIHSVNSVDTLDERTAMLDVSRQYPQLDLGAYRLRTLQGSDVIDLVVLTPLVVVERQISNWDVLHGGRSGSLLVTDCQSYVIGSYERVRSDRFVVGSQLSQAIVNHLDSTKHLQFYKVSRVLIYVSYEQDKHYLIHNFLDGSNFIRLPNIKGLKVMRDSEDVGLLNIEVLIPSIQSGAVQSKRFHVRMFNQ